MRKRAKRAFRRRKERAASRGSPRILRGAKIAQLRMTNRLHCYPPVAENVEKLLLASGSAALRGFDRIRPEDGAAGTPRD